MNNLIDNIKKYCPICYINTKYDKSSDFFTNSNILKEIENHSILWDNYIPYFASNFEIPNNKIDSPLIDGTLLLDIYNTKNKKKASKMLIKADHLLPIAGSIKARGGIYEVISLANSIISKNDCKLNNLSLSDIRNLLKQYTIIVGSTGNLGLSIGLSGTYLGFNVEVHMSNDAKEWKKQLLRSHNATVIEYDADYSFAVSQGRISAQKNDKAYFIDDENSKTLFMGYSTAALYLKNQLEELNITVDSTKPLYVYLPCGVGGGPGGIAYGLKAIYGENVHPVFVEPTHAPCMLLGYVTGLHDNVSIYDYNLDGITEADGLAVGRASGFVGKLLENHLFALCSTSDEEMKKDLILVKNILNEKIEPSAAAGFSGFNFLANSDFSTNFEDATHIIWCTGGKMVPISVFNSYLI